VIGRAVPAILDLGWPRTRSSGVVRTRLIDTMVQEALNDGAAQLVLLGAGYDSRAYRLPLAREVTVFEVDHPATQRAKRARLGVSGTSVAHVRFVGVDFELENIADRLADAGFDERARSILVWEGVISYLSESAVDDNFELLSRICSVGSRLIFTYVDGRALDGSVEFEEARRWKGWVRLNGEPFVFGFHPDRLESYLAERGFRLDSDRSTAEVARDYRRELGRIEQGSDLYRVAEVTRANQCPG
jgi:methyltransferase (TIGR00027 family)